MSTVALPNRFIIGPRADWLLFIGSPLLALGLGVSISGTPIATEEVSLLGHTNTATDMFLGTFIFAHLFIVFFRSHGNAGIRALYPARFWAAPVLLVGSMMASLWVYVCASVLATWWDVYHSGQQTFGLGRIYDRKAGNDPTVGRNLDIGLNQLLYAGPILAGATLWDHLEDFDVFARVESVYFQAVPYYVIGWSGALTRAVLLGGVAYLGWYVYRYWQLSQEGYRVSWQKVALLVSTGTVSIFTWGFNSFGEAFFIMNFFHALQYFALVWKMEATSISELLRVGRPLALGAFLAIAFAFGLWAEIVPASNRFAVSVITTVALLHFWYDGFIWSVRKGQVA